MNKFKYARVNEQMPKQNVRKKKQFENLKLSESGSEIKQSNGAKQNRKA